MRYWEDFWNKYGFGDGSAVPPDACQLRKVYVPVVNAKAQNLGSKFRLVPYNRSGMHNWIIIVSATVAYHDRLTALERLNGTDRCPEGPGEQGEDEQMRQAIDWAIEQDPDQLVSTRVRIDRNGLRRLLAAAAGPQKTTCSRKENNNGQRPTKAIPRRQS